MIDLHMHTTYSDGTWPILKMLQEAENANLELISITDHDTLDAYFELNNINYKEYYKGKIINGVELNVVFDGFKFEALCYDFDLNIMKKFIYDNYKAEELNLNKEFEMMYNNCLKYKIKISNNLKYNKEDGWPIDVIYADIKKYSENKELFHEEEWSNIDKFFFSCLVKKDFPLFIDWSIHYPTINEVYEIVKKSGGKVFVAHIFRYGFYEPIKFLDELRVNNIIDGIEVYHSSFTSEQISVLESYCNKYNLMMCGGSDCHGDKNAERKIGVGFGNLNIPMSIIDNWSKKRNK